MRDILVTIRWLTFIEFTFLCFFISFILKWKWYLSVDSDISYTKQQEIAVKEHKIRKLPYWHNIWNKKCTWKKQFNLCGKICKVKRLLCTLWVNESVCVTSQPDPASYQFEAIFCCLEFYSKINPVECDIGCVCCFSVYVYIARHFIFNFIILKFTHRHPCIWKFSISRIPLFLLNYIVFVHNSGRHKPEECYPYASGVYVNFMNGFLHLPQTLSNGEGGKTNQSCSNVGAVLL